MRCLLLLLSSLFLISCESSVEMSSLIYQNGQYLQKDSEKVYSGMVTGLEEGKIENGIKQGAWTEYDANGQKKTEGTYTDGFKTGPWKIYHQENGQLWKQGSYDAKGLRTGEWTTFGKDGALWEKGNFKDDRQEGAWEYYHLTGEVRLKGNMIQGKRTGVWTYYDKEGNQTKTKTWDMGKEVSNTEVSDN